MINYYGIFQLVDIKKIKKEEDGQQAVYFLAAETGKDNGGHFKFFKMKGKQTKFFLDNLRKKENGKYASRRLFLSGYIYSYKKEEKIPLEKTITKGALPEAIGTLHCGFKVTINKIKEFEKEMFVVTHFEFADSKEKEEDINFTVEDSALEIENEYISEPVKTNSKEIKNDIEHAMNDLTNFNTDLIIPEEYC